MSRHKLERNLSEKEYLEAEEIATVRHEYIDGHVFSITGASDAHNRICGNLFAFLHGHLRGSRCSVFTGDMKVRVESGLSYYYPDIMVSCERFDARSVFKEKPVLLVEVLSPSTSQMHIRIVFGRGIACFWPDKRIVFGHRIAFNLAGETH